MLKENLQFNQLKENQLRLPKNKVLNLNQKKNNQNQKLLRNLHQKLLPKLLLKKSQLEKPKNNKVKKIQICLKMRNLKRRYQPKRLLPNHLQKWPLSMLRVKINPRRVLILMNNPKNKKLLKKPQEKHLRILSKREKERKFSKREESLRFMLMV